MIIQDKLDHTFSSSFLAFSCLASYMKQYNKKTFDYSEIEKDMENAKKIYKYLETSNIKFGIVSFPAGIISLSDGTSCGRILRAEQVCLEKNLRDETLDNFFKQERYSELNMHFRVQSMLPREEVADSNPTEYIITLRYSKVGEPKE